LGSAVMGSRFAKFLRPVCGGIVANRRSDCQ
jgi:hypothetical protein